MFSDTADSSDMEISQFAYSVNVGLKGEGIVKDNAQVSCRGSGVDFEISYLDGDVWSGLEEFGMDGEELGLIIIQFK